MSHGSVRVDVGIPAYKRTTYLLQALESVLAQTFTDFRVTISDNGPGGGDVERAIQPYLEDRRVSYVSTGGVPQHENLSRLIRTGEAPYVALLHDDDVWDPDYLERRVEFLDAHPECALVFSSNYQLDEEGRRSDNKKLALREGVLAPEEFLPVLYERNPVAPPTPVVRRSAYEAVGPAFTDELRRYFDYEMLFRLGARFPVGYLDVRDCGYRLHKGSVTSASRHFGEEHLRSLDVAERIVAAERPGLRFDPDMRARVRSFYSLRASMDLLEQGNRRGALRHLVNAVRLRPRMLGDVRFAASAGTLLLGPAGPRLLQRARARRDQRGLARRLAGST